MSDTTPGRRLVVVGAEAVLGRLTILNHGASVGHDNVIGDGAHVAPGCALAGNVFVGKRTLVGVGGAVRPGPPTRTKSPGSGRT